NPVVGSLLRILLHPRNLSSESVGDPPHQIGEVHHRLAEIKEDEKFAIGHWRSASEESYAAPRSVIAHPDLGPEFLQESVVVLVGCPREPCPAFHRHLEIVPELLAEHGSVIRACEERLCGKGSAPRSEERRVGKESQTARRNRN